MCPTGGFTRKSSLVAKRISYVVRNVFDFSYIICRKKQKTEMYSVFRIDFGQTVQKARMDMKFHIHLVKIAQGSPIVLDFSDRITARGHIIVDFGSVSTIDY
ncbi:hypothetical protein SAMN02744102_02792 [Paenibacillus barengoltzii]|nr:hypothetical protein SAMN02744102_02792 [Paenibacillus barengoltzii]